MSQYKKITDIEHVLLRPGMYIGAGLEPENIENYICNDDKIIQKNIEYSQGLYKIFDEIIVNTYDHCVRTRTLDKKEKVSIIKVSIDKQEKSISVMNNGFPIDTRKHPEYNEYIPEIIFGNLRTSENYSDNDRITGGLNGLGSKLTNIYSKKFIVEIGNTKTKEYYLQIFEDNLSKIGKPKISKYSKKLDYLNIKFFPDLERFKTFEFSDDLINLFKKRTMDLLVCTRWLNNKISIFFNDELLEIPKIIDYLKMYDLKTELLCFSPNENWDIVVGLSDDFKQISFVNGIYTKNGGNHVNYILNQIIDKITETLQKKNKDIPIKKQFIKNNLFLFIRCNIKNSDFSNQIKDELTKPTPSHFGSEAILTKQFIEKIGNLGLYEKVLELAEFKNKSKLKKNDGKKKKKLYLPKYNSAEYSGTIKSNECTLILTEGDSAATMIISGLSQEQRKYFGIFPLKGKLLNVSEISTKKLIENEEINNLKKILGLEQGKEYINTNSLRYGKIMVATDSDVDGYHIKGLLFNVFNILWPSLFKFDNFLNSFLTPIVKVTKGNEIKSFYTLNDYNNWKNNNNTKNYKIKYYKGLGTSTKEEAKEYFKNLDKNLIKYKYSKNSTQLFDLAFNKKRADDRKKWLMTFSEPQELNRNSLTFDNFINNELILFSMEDVSRNIPHILDGLKTSQRKVLYSALKRNLTNEIKVSQFGGYVSEVSGYHHGEKSLEDTIINMARNFIGTNNINLLVPMGQFGSRLTAKDNASSRYIFTKLSPITKILFDINDNQLLTYLDDDGFLIEPEYYFPIIPILLVNGTKGIGTGFSTMIPNYNPKDIIENIKLLLENKKLKQLLPWYKNFLGTIKESKDGYETIGNYNYDEINRIITITELPIGTWTMNYKDFLIELVNSNKIKDFIDRSADEIVYFKIYLNDEKIKDFISFFKLSTKLSINNMHLFNKEGKIKKYKSIDEIQIEFFNERLKFYTKRKNFILNDLQNKVNKLSEKVRFIKGVREEKINIKLNSEKVIEILEKMKFLKIENNYNYLLEIPIKNLTQDNIDKMEKEMNTLKKELLNLKNKTIKELYLEDLEEIEKYI